MRGLGQTPLVVGIANAIAQMEGFNTPGTRPNLNNNPGDLISWSGVPTSNGFAQFPTAAAGWAALYQQIELNISRGLTLVQFFAGEPGVYPGYAPGGSGGNNPQQYAQFVAQQVGIDPNTPLNQIDPNTLQGSAAPAITPPCDPSTDPTCTGVDSSGNPCDPTTDPNCPGSTLGGSGTNSGFGTGETIALVAIVALAVWYLWD